MKKIDKSKHTNYPVGDFLIRIKNAALAKRKSFDVKTNKELLKLSEVLKKEGYLEDFIQKDSTLSIKLAYKSKEPVVLGLKLVSTPGLRIYMSVKEIEKKRGPSVYLISSPKGIITSREAVKNRLGGEIVAEIW